MYTASIYTAYIYICRQLVWLGVRATRMALRIVEAAHTTIAQLLLLTGGATRHVT